MSAVVDRLVALLLHAVALLLAALIAWVLIDLARRGIGAIDLGFLIGPVEANGRSGGIGPVLVSTAGIVFCCLAISLPLALGTALCLDQLLAPDSRLAALVRGVLDLLAAIPSIIIGLFGSAFFCLTLGLGFSLVAGGLTLACMILPLLTRLSIAALQAVPAEQRQAGAGLGLTRSGLIRRVLLPQALPGLAGALALCLGRALAETAALLYASGSSTRMPDSLLDSGRSLSVHIFELAMHLPGGDRMAAASALVLAAILILLTVLVRGLAHRLGRGGRS